jgi:hypothetical protein
MATKNSTTSAARKSVRKAQAARKAETPRQRALSQPEGRAKPGSKGSGEYFRIEVRPKAKFASFRTQDVGDPGHIQRVAGQRESGSWATQAWLISKEDAHLSGERLVADSRDAKALLKKLGSAPTHIKGDVFQAKDRPNVPEARKPTVAQRQAQARNIRKAQTARGSSSRGASGRASSSRSRPRTP